MPFEPAETSPDTEDLAALLGSRLCHDLISPLGAINNGVELLAMSGQRPGPELDLIAQSVAAANARVKFFRVAFGQASADQQLGRAEIVKLLSDLSAMGRVKLHWEAEGDQPRLEVKLAFLAQLCLETILPFGGDIVTRCEGGFWTITAHSEKARPDPGLWTRLDNSQIDVSPAQVQFALLPDAAARAGLPLNWELTATGGEIRIG